MNNILTYGTQFPNTNYFDDALVTSPYSSLNKIISEYSDYIYSIETFYYGQSAGIKQGQGAHSLYFHKSEINLDLDESIIQVNIKGNNEIQALNILTNKGRNFTIGNSQFPVCKSLSITNYKIKTFKFVFT